jgi:hypothetical protein
MKRLFHTSRLFRSIRKMPTPEDASMRQNPVVETWNDLYQERGLARVNMWFTGIGYETYFNLIEGSWPVTHWRWM